MLHLYRNRRYSLRSSTEMLILLARCSFSFRICLTAQCMTVMSFLRPRLAGVVFTHDRQPNLQTYNRSIIQAAKPIHLTTLPCSVVVCLKILGR